MAKKSNLPISVEELERQVAAIAKPSAVAQAAAEPAYSSTRIIRTGNTHKFTVEDGELKRPLQVVILAAVHVQAYYDTKYDPENKTPPVCFALAEKEIELIPHETAPQKQHDGPCAMCPQNKPGSGELGGWTRACSGRRRLALLSIDDRTDDPAIATIEISAGGLRYYAGYVKSLTTVEGIPTYLAVTALDYVDTKKETWYIGAQYVNRLTQVRPDWVTPKGGVKIGSEGWLDHTIIGRKVREVVETKMLLAPPSVTVAEKGAKKKGGKPVTGAARMSVKDAKKLRKK